MTIELPSMRQEVRFPFLEVARDQPATNVHGRYNQSCFAYESTITQTVSPNWRSR